MPSLERLAQVLTALMAAACLAHGLVMTLAPIPWYQALPTVQATGPANHHFIVDVGLAYLASGSLLAFGASCPSTRRGALIAGTLWLALHGAFHLVEFFRGETPLDHFLIDAPAVLAPPLLLIAALTLLRMRRDESARSP